MPEFSCKVGTPSGDVREETHVAPDEATLREELQQRELHVFSVKPMGAGVQIGGFRIGGRAKRVPRRQFMMFNQELATLIRAGLPLLQCIETLLERMPAGHFRRYLTDIQDRLKSGSALSDAFAAQGEAFPRIYSTTLMAGERSGELRAVITRYVDFVRKAEALRSRVSAALIYPALLTTMSFSLVALLMFYILPKFAGFYAEFGRELPTITVVVISAATWLQSNLALFVVVLFVLFVAARVYHATAAGRLFFHSAVLKIPIVGSVLHRYNVAQLCRTLSTMLSGGIPLVASLQTTAGSLGNEKMVNAVNDSLQKVKEGQPLWESLEETGSLTDLSVELMKVGETTGSLPTMLNDIAEFYDNQVDEAMTRVVALFEPVLLIVMGGLVAFLLLAMYLPIFRMVG